jgi:hypothetical protein
MAHEKDNDEGMSTGKKVIAGAAIGVAVPAAVGVAKKLIGNDEDEQGEGSGQSGSSQQRGERAARSSSSSRSRTAGTKRASSTSKRTSSGSRSQSRSSAQSGGSRTKSSPSQRSGSSSAGGRSRTKEQLYNTAKRLNIEGRSSMTKAQLERAVRARS